MAYKVENSPIYYKTWATKGVREVRHLNSFLSLAEFREGCKIKINYLIFHGIVAAIKPKRKIFVGKKFHRIQTGAIIRDGDRKRGVHPTLCVVPKNLFLEKIAPTLTS